MSFFKITHFGLTGCEEDKAEIVHIYEYKKLQKRIAELEKQSAWGIHHFTKEELAIRDLEMQALALENVAKNCKHAFNSWAQVKTHSLGIADYELVEKAEQLRKQAKKR